MRLKRNLSRLSPIFLIAALSAPLAQQTEPEPQPQTPTGEETTPAEPADAPQPQAEPPSDTESSKSKIALYVEAGYGSWSPRDIDSSIATGGRARSENTISFDDQDYARAAIGWKLAGGKGDFRLVFSGWSENGYSVQSQGFLKGVDPSLTIVTPGRVTEPLLWWNLEIENGQLHSVQTPPFWIESMDDANGNTLVDPGEQRYPVVAKNINTNAPSSLQNRAQIYDFLFGNVWGPRRVQGRWFAGFRYFLYQGNLLAPAWLAPFTDGPGYTDGAFLNLLNFSQDTKGFGPTGLMEARFNFFNSVLQLFINGQAAFMVEKIETSSSGFITLVRSGGLETTVPALLEDSQTKSTWHTGAEAGIRVRLKNGLKFEAAYGVVGLLDAVLLPNQVRVPENVVEAREGSSAIYNTQDYVLTGWRAGVAFQF